MGVDMCVCVLLIFPLLVVMFVLWWPLLLQLFPAAAALLLHASVSLVSAAVN